MDVPKPERLWRPTAETVLAGDRLPSRALRRMDLAPLSANSAGCCASARGRPQPVV